MHAIIAIINPRPACAPRVTVLGLYKSIRLCALLILASRAMTCRKITSISGVANKKALFSEIAKVCFVYHGKVCHLDSTTAMHAFSS